jgi:hypothetical protein
MKVFYLTVNSNKNDVISKVVTDSLEKAVYYFTQIKKLHKEELLKIYTVVE